MQLGKSLSFFHALAFIYTYTELCAQISKWTEETYVHLVDLFFSVLINKGAN